MIHKFGKPFYIGSQGLLSTCAHIVEPLADGEILIAKDFNLDTFLEVKDIICHQSTDFAVGRINVNNSRFLCPLDSKSTPVLMGTDVQAFSFENYGKQGEDLALRPRFFKGYISFIGRKPEHFRRCRTLCELSFPSLAGFSGAPVMYSTSDNLLGMLYDNKESSIEVFSHSEVEEGEKRYSERIFRTMEFGLVHTIDDIQVFLKDLGIKAFR